MNSYLILLKFVSRFLKISDFTEQWQNEDVHNWTELMVNKNNKKNYDNKTNLGYKYDDKNKA